MRNGGVDRVLLRVGYSDRWKRDGTAEVILRSLENNGVHRGCFGFALNGEDIRNHVLLEIPELSWVAVNVSGRRANVEVRERRTAPKPLDRKKPCNLVARRDGLVLRVQALGASLRC